ncbi:Type II secretion system protein J precursor [Vibrio mangrovi]|uniref:Type II secretion system protein J n=2 Tax=Vibrio mangrovi TaxID=474394 RepID=A0A1Y6IYU5_9VIBR|nr:type II secretion system minor pseudopilin GspJ [Vibrio mangrovi]MDW6002639.1 type II secretion system minor pseudopilin GspJ [Vibrio mangrovi]SMS02798.1 Type II secretion system protein J precursor [Vibrio mangrovi]
MKHRNQGFTLIEVLVALAILASLTMAAYQVLNQVQRSNVVSKESEIRLGEIQKALAVMDSDFRQMASRQFRNQGEEPGAQLLWMQDGLLSSEGVGILFTRHGWVNPQMQFPRGDIMKVGYRLIEDRLERIWWRYPDTVAGDNGIGRPLLTQVESMSFRLYRNHQWVERWEDKGVLPEAISVKLTLKDYGQIERIYLVAGSELSLSNVSD